MFKPVLLDHFTFILFNVLLLCSPSLDLCVMKGCTNTCDATSGVAVCGCPEGMELAADGIGCDGMYYKSLCYQFRPLVESLIGIILHYLDTSFPVYFYVSGN